MDKETFEENCKSSHPGFTIICDECSSKNVYFENDMGWSAESGGWGSADLVCASCGTRSTLIDS